MLPGFFFFFFPAQISRYNTWHDVELILHVTPVLSAEEIRRLVGNDIGLIFFVTSPYDVENPFKFDCSGIETLGEVPCVFAVVQPNQKGTLFSIAFFSKKTILPHSPPPPITPLPLEQAGQLVLTKLYHGLLKVCLIIFWVTW